MITNELTNKICGALFVLLAIFTIASTGWAATYYVDVTKGNDRNSGTDPSLPWKYCPGMSQYSGAGSLKFGDIVYFDRSSTWETNTGDQVLNCTDGVTYDGSTWGNGTRATLRPTAALNHAVIFIAVSNVVVKGFNVDANHLNLSGISMNWPYSKSNISNIEINDCVVHDTCQTDVYKYGILVGSTNGNTTSNVSIINCTVYNTGHEGICLYPSSASSNQISNITVRNCNVFNTGMTNQSYGAGILIKNNVNGAIIEYNYLYSNGHCGIQFETVSDIMAPNSVIIRHNIVKDNARWGLYLLNGGNRAYNFDFYGNLLINNGEAGSYEGGALMISSGNYGNSTFKFYNNTFFGIGNAATNPYSLVTQKGVLGTPVIEVKNNIFYTNNHTAIYDQVGSLFSPSNNLFFRTSAAGDVMVYDGGQTYNAYNIVNWDLNAINLDPQFVNISNLPTSINSETGPSPDGLDTKSGSPARDSGVDLGSEYQTSINLVNRPNGARWDIGAYELSKILPPNNFRIKY